MHYFGACLALLLASNSALAAASNFSGVTLQALNKVTARVSELKVERNLPARFGTLDIEVKSCWTSPSHEKREHAALLEIRERSSQNSLGSVIFSGWMFASSPTLSALEHPVYDLTLIACEK